MEIFLLIIVFLFGISVGSFANVIIYRLPENQSIVLPRSYCPACRKSIAAYDNIPLLSFTSSGNPACIGSIRGFTGHNAGYSYNAPRSCC